MADLDDFFAKKDKNKKSSKKFPTPQDVSKQLEENAAKAKEAKQKKEIPPVTTEKNTENNLNEVSIVCHFFFSRRKQKPNFATIKMIKKTYLQTDEWKEFVEEGAKDYTGLKIGNLQLNDNDYLDTDGDGDGDNGDNKDSDRPWQNQNEDDEKTKASKERKRKEETSGIGGGASTGVYVPKQLLKTVNIKKGHAPDLNNEEYFPTLGAAKAEELRRKKNEPAFEEVKHGGRLQRSSDLDKNAPVIVGNRYNTLSDSQKIIYII